MPDILVGATIKSQDFPAAVYQQDTTTLTDVSNTTYATGSPVVDVTFTAPTSGRVWLLIGAGMSDSGGNRPFVSAEVYEGVDATGTLILAADDITHGVVGVNTATRGLNISRATNVTGLTVGATHYARLVHRVTGGTTIDIDQRDITVIPLT